MGAGDRSEAPGEYEWLVCKLLGKLLGNISADDKLLAVSGLAEVFSGAASGP